MLFDSEYAMPDFLEKVVRFDPTGLATDLGEMTGEGLQSLMDLWCDSGYVVLEPLTTSALVLLPAHYIKTGQPLPDRMTRSISTHMLLWHMSDQQPKPPADDFGGYDFDDDDDWTGEDHEF